jgi:hypothetical protein
MTCFTMQFFENLLIWIVIIAAIYAIVNLLLPIVFANFGGPGAIMMRVIGIFMWAIIVIAIIIFVFDLISCLVGGGGLGLHMPRHQ